MTFPEFRYTYLNAKFNQPSQNAPRNAPKRRKLQAASQSINWVEEGVVPPIRDQGWCGSCWAFAASGGMETAKLIYDPQHYSPSNIHVSEQQQVDCVHTSYGCEGGWSEDSFKVAISVGFTNGQAYQYTGTTGSCKRTGGEFKIYDYEHYKMTCE